MPSGVSSNSNDSNEPSHCRRNDYGIPSPSPRTQQCKGIPRWGELQLEICRMYRFYSSQSACGLLTRRHPGIFGVLSLTPPLQMRVCVSCSPAHLEATSHYCFSPPYTSHTGPCLRSCVMTRKKEPTKWVSPKAKSKKICRCWRHAACFPSGPRILLCSPVPSLSSPHDWPVLDRPQKKTT